MDYAPRKISKPVDATVFEAGEKKEGFHHLDTNNHVNNAQYVAIAAAQLPADYKTNIFRAEYKMQSKLGDVLYPVVKTTDEGYIVVLNDGDGNAKLVCEFL